MDSCSAVQRIVAILVIVAGACGDVYAGPVYTYHGSFNLPIPAPDEPESEFVKGWMADAIIDVPHHFTIHDIDVGISLTHTSVFDLQIFLQSPAGTRICLNMYNPFDEFFVGANYTNTIFDDEADVSIEESEAPFTGRFRPRTGNLLEVFDGQVSFGLWRLQIYDSFYADTGNLDSFELMITTPEPATATLLTLGAGLLLLLRPRRGR